MAHPHRSAARGSVKAKFNSMLGSPKGAKHTDNDSVVKPHIPAGGGVEDVKIMGAPPQARLDRARGGKVAKKGVTVNVIVPPSPAPGPMPMRPPMPSAPGPAGAMPPMPPPGSPPGNGPVPPMPVPQKAGGGYISGEANSNALKRWAQYARGNSYHKKHGGGIGKYPLTAGAESGVGRLQHSKKQRKP